MHTAWMIFSGTAQFVGGFGAACAWITWRQKRWASRRQDGIDKALMQRADADLKKFQDRLQSWEAVIVWEEPEKKAGAVDGLAENKMVYSYRGRPLTDHTKEELVAIIQSEFNRDEKERQRQEDRSRMIFQSIRANREGRP